MYHQKYVTLETKYQLEEEAKEENIQLARALESELEVARGELSFLNEQLVEKQDDVAVKEKKIKELEKLNEVAIYLLLL